MYYQRYELLTGIDEAGRGPLAGPLVVAGVTVNKGFELPGLNDSKQLSDKKRRELYTEIMASVLSSEIVIISEQEIDELNILAATMQGMTTVWQKLNIKGMILIDGNRLPEKLKHTEAEAVVKGDGRISAIAAASILAKVTRDNIMLELDKIYPEYGFARNKGYGTAEHLRIIGRLGITPCHRKSYRPVSQIAINFE
ncbi:MAG: ribonuclease HII [Candidatus Cloacimonetes bacterium]|nr:ribonuclease HII [Candidatus Cloacimonadota bacterium]